MISVTAAIALTALWVGAWQDWHTRTASNKIWIVALALAAPLLAWELFTHPSRAAWRLLACVVTFAFAWRLWRGQAMGAADAKALAIISLLVTPVGYYAPAEARFLPALDAFFPALLIAEGWRRATHQTGTPFLAVLAPVTTATLLFGGLLWIPIVRLMALIS